jgi:hypothetical protein
MGDCFEQSLNYMINECLFDKEKRKHVFLAHGHPTLAVPPFIKYVHAWIEYDDDTVYDVENDSRVPKELYYGIGKIDSSACFRYTYAEMRKKVTEHQHSGPWDLEMLEEEEEYREELEAWQIATS